MLAAGLVPLRGRGVVPVVAGQVQVAQVHGRVAPVQFQVAELDPGRIGERGQLGLVVRVGQRRVGACGVVQRAQAGRTPARERSWTRPSYSCRPLHSRTSAT